MAATGLMSTLESLLPQYVCTQRWFRGKTRTIETISVSDVIHAASADHFILILDIAFTERQHDFYLLPVEISQNQNGHDEIIARVADKVFSSALSNQHFRAGLIDTIAGNGTLKGPSGDLVAAHTSAFDRMLAESPAQLPSHVSRAEQSNTSIVYGDRFIFKLFRKIEPGINPDVEVGTFLTGRGFRNTPAVLGTLEYHHRESGCVYSAGILQEFVRNQGDAWSFTLASLKSFFERALASGDSPPELISPHPLDLASRPIPASEEQLFGDYLASARLLGQRTAEMHIALADPAGPAAFAPEPYTPAYGQELFEEMIAQTNLTFELLRHTDSVARDLLPFEKQIMGRFNKLREAASLEVSRIRQHGDYHLGQVLYTGSDFMIVDFEGEPARPLAERRAKGVAMRDLAGMLRSFQYAAYSAAPAGAPPDRIAAWANFWNAIVSAAFLDSYFTATQGLPFVPTGHGDKKFVLDAFLLQKALYEVAYELNNRPAWVHIPIRGILALIT